MVDELVRHKALRGHPEISHGASVSEFCETCQLQESVRVLNQEIDRLRDFEEEVRLLKAKEGKKELLAHFPPIRDVIALHPDGYVGPRGAAPINCDELRASRIYDSLRGRLKADPTRQREFIRAMGQGVEIFEFDSDFGIPFRFLNRDGIWAVGYDIDQLVQNPKGFEIFEAVRGMNDMALYYLQCHFMSGMPGPEGIDLEDIPPKPHESKEITP